jgi:hypothetical protein
MQERAALVGASLEIESKPGHGTTILVRMAITTPAVPDGPEARRAPHPAARSVRGGVG